MDRALLDLRLLSARDAAAGVRVFAFGAPDGTTLPPAAPGSHIELHLPRSRVRSYSLLDAEAAPRAYRIAVKLETGGRGGSRWLHEAARTGFRFLVGAPACGFPLVEEPVPSLFIAGGIGIAAIRSMIVRLDRLGRDWTLHYAARCRADAAFADELAGFGPRVMFHGDESRLDVGTLVAATPAATELYCCGPRAMMQAFERAAVGRDPACIHTEYFFPRDEPRLGGFTAELARTGRSVAVAPGQTLLDALAAAGVAVPSACLEGICGRCEVVVLAGTPDHRDTWLTQERRAAGRSLLACCSGALGARLVLDL